MCSVRAPNLILMPAMKSEADMSLEGEKTAKEENPVHASIIRPTKGVNDDGSGSAQLIRSFGGLAVGFSIMKLVRA